MKRHLLPFILIAGTVHWIMPTAQAGYTHYFTWQQQPDKARLAACLGDMQRVVEAARVTIAGPDGEGVPTVGPSRMEFNGIGEGAHEPFSFPGTIGFNSCKTQAKPYDAVVTACLLVARDHFSAAILEIFSDGDWDEGDWGKGAALYQQVFGRIPANPMAPAGGLPDEPEYPGAGSGVFRLIIVAVIAVGVWMLLRPRHAFVIRIRDGVARASQGKVTQAFVAEVSNVCHDHNIGRGSIKGVRMQKWTVLMFSRQIPRQVRQRIRNLWIMSR